MTKTQDITLLKTVANYAAGKGYSVQYIYQLLKEKNKKKQKLKKVIIDGVFFVKELKNN